MSRKLRILCLHGYGQNATFFRQRTGSLRKTLKPLVADFHFLDGPYPATASFLSESEDRGAQLGWWKWEDSATRAATSLEYRGIDETFARVREACDQHGPFDGVLGFSQGATLAAMLCLEPLARGALPPFRFAVLVAGFVPRDPKYAALIESLPLIDLPTLHVSGDGDTSVPSENTRRLAGCFARPEFLTHAGGHALPSDAGFRAQLKDFVQRQAAASADGPATGSAAGSAAPAAAGGGGGGGAGAVAVSASGTASASGSTPPPQWRVDEAARCASAYAASRLVRGGGGPLAS